MVALSGKPATPLTAHHQGIVVVNAWLRLHFMNTAAKAIFALFHSQKGGSDDRVGTLPKPIIDCYEQLQHVLRGHHNPHSWERVHISRTLQTPTSRIYVRGFGIPGEVTVGDSHLLLLTLDRLPDQAPSTALRPLSIQGTEREQDIVRCLFEGMTNKEIASRLGLSVHTVRDHLKRIRMKTGSSTRTAILSHMVRISYAADSILIDSALTRLP